MSWHPKSLNLPYPTVITDVDDNIMLVTLWWCWLHNQFIGDFSYKQSRSWTSQIGLQQNTSNLYLFLKYNISRSIVGLWCRTQYELTFGICWIVCIRDNLPSISQSLSSPNSFYLTSLIVICAISVFEFQLYNWPVWCRLYQNGSNNML